MSTPREDLANLLRDLRGGGSFSTRRTAPAGDLLIEVRDVGPLRLPLTAGQAKQLRLVARPARYGRGTETLLDRRVRDTWEVPKSRVSIDARRWANTLRPMLDQVRDDLGLAPTCSLKAELHSMLVYEPGQFFAAHQDSEKDDRMIGSLVVLLPSRSTGGDLVLSHHGDSVTHRGSPTALTFIAFYADTRHEVLPVDTGYRVALTYNLLLAGDASGAADATPGPASTAAALLRQYFEAPSEPRWPGDKSAGEPPDRLVFLLDHQYSEHSLRWTQLKGEDAARAAVVRAAADQTDCDVALALAEIQETWDCEYVGPSRRGRRGWSRWDDEEDPDDAYELVDLVDSNVEIRAVDGRTVGGPHVADVELATSTPNVDLTPYDTEFTGYMGNYGNTLDRWYRRAAVVIWPRSRAFALRARGDPAGAVDELRALDDDPADSTVAERRAAMTAALLRFWPEAVRSHDQQALIPGALELAAALDNGDLAARLLDPFMLEALSVAEVPALVAAVERHGSAWLDARLAAWMPERWNRRPDGLPSRHEWVESLPTLCEHVLGATDSAPLKQRRDVAARLVAATWTWLHRTISAANGTARPSVRVTALTSLGAPLLAVLHAAAALDDARLRSEVVAATSTGRLSPLLVATIDAAGRLTPAQRASIDLGPLARQCADELREELDRPERASDDWSIEFQGAGCCADCAELGRFLHDAAAKQLVWPLAKARREHIHRQIDEAEIPVTHQTRREGSPHKLVLTKTAALFTGEAARRRRAEAELARLEG